LTPIVPESLAKLDKSNGECGPGNLSRYTAERYELFGSGLFAFEIGFKLNDRGDVVAVCTGLGNGMLLG
jgi:hypothetical protein